MKKHLFSILMVAILLTTMFSFDIFASGSITLNNIANTKAGDEVTITGTNTLDGATLQLKRPNGTVLYVCALTKENFQKKLKLPSDVIIGTYTVIVGKGSVKAIKTFDVVKSKVTPPSSSGSSSSSSSSKSRIIVKKEDNGNVTVVVKQPKVDKENNKAKVSINIDDMEYAFEQAKANVEGKVKIQINLSQMDDVEDYQVKLPKKIFQSNGKREIEVKTKKAIITLPDDMLKDEEIQESQYINLSCKELEKVNGRPAIEINLMENSKVRSWKNGNTQVKISLPYALLSREDPEHIVVWYIDENGNKNEVPNGFYNKKTGLVEFKVNHFGEYAIGYVEKTFNDLNNFSWAKSQIEVLASKGIIKGIGKDLFAPENSITKAEYITLLVRLFEFNIGYEDDIKDVNKSDNYYNEVGIAKALGIIDNEGNNKFMPNVCISREDMMLVTYRALKLKGLLENEKDDSVLNNYLDKADIADYAKDSVVVLVQEKLIQGSNNKMIPKGKTTRAEAAVLLYRIYNKLNSL